MSEFPPPLPADERRRATQTTAAYIFQWWHSVLAWLELRDDEFLYVESSEDFESVSTDRGTTVQVKAGKSGTLTLRSPEVLDALNHYWSIVKVETRKIQFVLLAQADAGMEQRPGLRANVSGIELWSSVRRAGSTDAIEQLRCFLRDDERVTARLAPDLRQFIREASTDDLRIRLIEPVVFDLNRPGSDVVQQLVRDRLVTIVNTIYGATVMEAERAMETVFIKVVELAASKARVPLGRAHLLQLLEANIVEYRHRMSLALPPRGPISTTHEESALWNAPSEELALPPLPARILARPELVEETLGRFHGTDALVLTGSTGTGKTTLAKLIARACGGDWWWLDLQDCLPNAAQYALRKILGIADRHRGTEINIVIDGFATDGLPETALNTLRAVVLQIRNRGGKILFTSQRGLTQAEAAAYGLTEVVVTVAPPMEKAEIQRLLFELGCLDEPLAETWSLAIHLHTQGHPQLVHAGGLWLQRQKWPKFDANTFQASSSSVNTERARAHRLVAKLANDERELLTRLSVLGNTFRRDHALGVAEKLERMAGAGFLFDELLGPWIEPADAHGYHRLSPLLADSASMISHTRRTDIDRACALARLEGSPVYFQDAALALRHAFSAKAADLVMHISAKVLLTPHEHQTYAFGQLLWLTWLTDAVIDELDAAQKGVAQVVHLLRFQIVVTLQPEKVRPYLAACERSMIGGDALAMEGQRFVLLTEVLSHCAKYLPGHEVVRYLEQVSDLAVTMDEELRRVVLFPRDMLPPFLRTVSEEENIRISLAGFVLNAAEGQVFVTELMTALGQLPEGRRIALVRAFGAWPCLLSLVIDRLWLKEAEQANPAWEPLLAWFAAMSAKAAEWNADSLVVVFVRGASIVCNEYLDDTDRSARLLADIDATTPGFSALILDQKAKIAGRKSQFREAMVLMHEALPNWEESDFGAHPKMMALQRAGTWAGKASAWSESADFFSRGAKIARERKMVVSEAGLLTDAAVAKWRAGEKRVSVDMFARAIDLCAEMGPSSGDLATFQFQKLLGHILLQLAMGHRCYDSTPVQAPVIPGMASDPNLNEKVKTLPAPRLGACKAFVAMLEHDHLREDALWVGYQSELMESRSLSTRGFALELAIRKAVRRADLGILPSLAAKHASVEAVVRQVKDDPDHLIRFEMNENAEFPKVTCPIGDLLSGDWIFQAGLLSAAMQRPDISEAIREIEAKADDSPFPIDLRKWTGRALDIAALTESELVTVTRSAEAVSDRVIASAILLSESRLAPESLWGALYVAGSALDQNYWGGDVLNLVDEFGGKRWRAAMENRFAFRNPTLWLPDLRAVCGERVTGMKRWAALLLAAAPALDLRLGAEILAQLRGMRAGTITPRWRKNGPGFD